MFTNLTKSSLAAMVGMAALVGWANPAEAQRYSRHRHVDRPRYAPTHVHYRHRDPVVVVNRPRYYAPPVYHTRPVVYSRPIVYREPVVYTEPAYSSTVVYRDPTVVVSTPSCSRPVVYTEPVFYTYPRDRFSWDFTFGRHGRHSSWSTGVGFDWR